MSSAHTAGPKVAIATFGCKLNQFESEAVLAQFRSRGYTVVDGVEDADVCVVNTCAVTATAERKVRSAIRSLHRRNERASILVVGCGSECAAEALAVMPGVWAVLGNSEKQHLFDFLPSLGESGGVHVGETSAVKDFRFAVPVDGLLGRTRGFVKIQDGCSQRCAYCIVPRLRGPGRSLAANRAVEQVKRLVDTGHVEVVLTGVAVGTYGMDRGEKDALADLLQKLERVPGLSRVRLGSVEPWAISEQLLEIMANSNVICPYLHVPIQSADDRLLRRMNRPYTSSRISRVFETAYRLRDDWGFGADVLTGFPGESDDSFEMTHRFIASSPISYLHVFPFSPRPGTAACDFDDRVPVGTTRTRVARLRLLDSELRQRFRERHIGTRQRVLFESRRVSSLLAGHAADYLDVHADAPDSHAGTIRDVLVTALHPRGVIGRVVDAR